MLIVNSTQEPRDSPWASVRPRSTQPERGRPAISKTFDCSAGMNRMDRAGDRSPLELALRWIVLYVRSLVGFVVGYVDPTRPARRAGESPVSPWAAGFVPAVSWGLGPPGRGGVRPVAVPVRARRLHDSMDSA